MNIPLEKRTNVCYNRTNIRLAVILNGGVGMSENNDLLYEVISKSGINKKSCLSEKIYRDEPILMTASQMSNYTPPIYRKMRDIAHHNPLASEAYIFYLQAKMMENHTDQYEYEVSFLRYYPTYHMMSDAQLRSYFSWRTQIRQGNIKKTNLSFAYIYVYELINGIGVRSAEEGFLKLLEFQNNYLAIDSHIGVYLNRWLKDYCIYYNLPKSCIQMLPENNEFSSVSILINSESMPDDLVFDSIHQISDYNFEASRFYKSFADDCRAVAADVVRELNRYYRNSGRFSNREYFFGTINEGKRPLFGGAVFYERPKNDGYFYHFDNTEEYEYRNRQWYFRRFMCFSGKAQKAGALLRTIDSKMRVAFKFKNTLKQGAIPEEWEAIIDKCIDNYLIKKRFESAPKIEIDLTCLHNIRVDAFETQQRLLIVQEEENILPVAQTHHPAELPVVEKKDNQTTLCDLHFDFLCCLLNGDDYKDLLRNNNTTISIVCDAINDSLFDEFCDTVIDFDGESPSVIPDYINQLKGYLGI